MDSSDEDTFFVSLLCEQLAAERSKPKRNRIWIHDICRDRELHGEYVTLFPKLLRDSTKFFQYFRMSYEKFKVLLDLIKDDLKKEDTHFRRCITPKERLAVCLRFLATGDSFRTIAFSYRMGNTTVANIVPDTCTIISRKLIPLVMPAPDSNKWKYIETAFRDRWNFPNCIGALDGKHVVIEAPGHSGSMYFNYKKTFSVVLMALVDADYCFIAVDIGAYGKNSDGGIYANRNFGKALNEGKFNVPPHTPPPGSDEPLPFVIVGDEAFPLKNNIMRPYPGSQIRGDESKKIFNYRLSRARRVSENAFGILSQRFRIYQRRIKMYPENLDNVIMATCCLHNFLKDDYLQNFEISNENESSHLNNLRNIGGNSTLRAIEIRDKFREYFISPAGAVPWQNDMVRLGEINDR